MILKEESQGSRISGANFDIVDLDDGIFHIYYHDNSLLTEIDFRESLEAYDEIRKGKKFKTLVELGIYTSITPEAREYAQSKMKIEAKAEAIVINGLAQRLLVRVYQVFRKQEHPSKVFNSKEKAFEWLHSI